MVSFMWHQHELKGNTTMQTKLEEMTKEYSLACVKAVQDTIHTLAEKWDHKVVDDLNDQDYKVYVELYNGSLCIYARIAKDDYSGPIRHENNELNAAVQEAFDKLGAQVVLNAMVRSGMESTDELVSWRVY